jgi:Acetamidase/Formamidase family
MTRHQLDPSPSTTADVFDRDLPPVLTVDPGDTIVLRAVPGALLSIGDGHAAQGDGEVAGRSCAASGGRDQLTTQVAGSWRSEQLEPAQCSRLEKTLIAVARMTAPNR